MKALGSVKAEGVELLLLTIDIGLVGPLLRGPQQEAVSCLHVKEPDTFRN